MKITLDFFRDCDILSPVSERNTKMNTRNIIDRVDSENASLRSQIDRLTGKTEDTVHDGHEEMFEAAEAVGTVRDDEIWDFGPEC